jgi:uncharacterized protein
MHKSLTPISKSLYWVLLVVFSIQLSAQDFPPKQSPPQLVNDYIELLNKSEKSRLEAKLRAYRDTTSTEIAVVIMATTKGDDVNLYAAELAQEWGIGKDGKDNGLIILVAKEDRNMAIQNGYGLEEKLTDFETKLIIEDYILPRFKQDQYYEGINDGTDQIFNLLAGTFKGKPEGKSKKGSYLPFLLLIALFLIFMFKGGRGKGGRNGGRRGGFGGIWIGGMGSSGGFGGGFGGGSSGGGFGGFGGGSFGGGGASGSW